MTVRVRILGQQDKQVSWEQTNGTVLDLLRQLQLSAQVYLAAINDEVVPLDHPVEDGDVVTLVRAVSGG